MWLKAFFRARHSVSLPSPTKKTVNSYFWSFISFRVIIHLVLHACSAHSYPILAGVPGQCPLIDGISNINDEKERSLLALVSCSVERLKACKGLEVAGGC